MILFHLRERGGTVVCTTPGSFDAFGGKVFGRGGRGESQAATRTTLGCAIGYVEPQVAQDRTSPTLHTLIHPLLTPILLYTVSHPQNVRNRQVVTGDREWLRGLMPAAMCAPSFFPLSEGSYRRP